jgi:hypothetical protein
MGREVVIKAIEGVISTRLFGNDSMTPSTTHYVAHLLDANGHVLEHRRLRITGTDDVDIAAL